MRFILVLSAVLSAHAPATAQQLWNCPDPETARLSFESGEIQDWPNYSESHGARVQRQHPDTAFIGAQAKYLEANGRTGAICQYYNHIGLVSTMIALDVKKNPSTTSCESECTAGAYWRSEFRESSPDLEEPGKEQMEVCMENRGGLSYPSVACGFLVPDDD